MKCCHDYWISTICWTSRWEIPQLTILRLNTWRTIFAGTREQAADAAASALADGMHPEAVGEAISMAANLLVLHDPGRRPENSTPQKPSGCVHGDSVGVHASDVANAGATSPGSAIRGTRLPV